jgi:hypothetical protein
MSKERQIEENRLRKQAENVQRTGEKPIEIQFQSDG